MNNFTLIKIGTLGAIVSALCCFTPVAMFLFGAVGLAAWVGYLDYVLMPAMLLFISLIIYGLTRKTKVSHTESRMRQKIKN